MNTACHPAAPPQGQSGLADQAGPGQGCISFDDDIGDKGVFAFLKKMLRGNASEQAMAAEISSAASGLDITAAIAAHENWKLRLTAFLEGVSKETFSPEVICFDDRCDLGKWIHGAGKARLGSYPGFTALLHHHKMFHYAASNVVSLNQAGKKAEAQKILDDTFSRFSSDVVADLKALKEISDAAGRKPSSGR
jgi:hydroxyethylthiazole kinase-like sugar kinase family protein